MPGVILMPPDSGRTLGGSSFLTSQSPGVMSRAAMGPELVAQHQATASIAKELLDTGEKIHFCLDFIFNPCPTELFVSVFRSFEAGIAFF